MSDYRDCMTSAMRSFPKGISREERGRLFCIEAKICSGKFTDRGAAEKDCINNPGQPKVSKGGRRGLDAGVIAACMMPKISDDITVMQLTNLISECSGKSGGPRIKKPQTKNQFIRKCAMEGGISELKLQDAVKLRKGCLAQWNEKEATNANA